MIQRSTRVVQDPAVYKVQPIFPKHGLLARGKTIDHVVCGCVYNTYI